MTGIALTVDVRDLQRLQQRLAKLTDLGPALAAIAAYGESSTRQRLSDDKTDPAGNAWEPWSPAYAKTRGPQHSLLESRGDLIDSIVHDSDAAQAAWGSNLIYAATHQLGDDSRGIPDRAYLGLSEADIDQILDLVEQEIDRVLQ